MDKKRKDHIPLFIYNLAKQTKQLLAIAGSSSEQDLGLERLVKNQAFTSYNCMLEQEMGQTHPYLTSIKCLGLSSGLSCEFDYRASNDKHYLDLSELFPDTYRDSLSQLAAGEYQMDIGFPMALGRCSKIGIWLRTVRCPIVSHVPGPVAVIFQPLGDLIGAISIPFPGNEDYRSAHERAK